MSPIAPETALATTGPALAPVAQASRPRRRLHLGRLRATVPVLLAGLAMAVDVPGGPYLLVIGLLGAILVWVEDGRAPVDAWRARFPSLPWGEVERLPRGEQARYLARVCTSIERALADLSAARGAPGLDPKRARRDLAGLLALAADLCAQHEQLSMDGGALHDPRLQRVEETLSSVLPAVERLRATLVRASTPGTSDHRPRLGSLLTLERELSAHQDCLDELEEL